MNGTMQKTNQNHSKTSKKIKKTWITSKKGMAFSWLLLMLQLLQNQQENLRKPSKTTPKAKNLRKPAAAAVLLLLLRLLLSKNGRLLGAKPPWQWRTTTQENSTVSEL